MTVLSRSRSLADQLATGVPAVAGPVESQVQHRPRSRFGPAGALALEAQVSSPETLSGRSWAVSFPAESVLSLLS